MKSLKIFAAFYTGYLDTYTDRASLLEASEAANTGTLLLHTWIYTPVRDGTKSRLPFRSSKSSTIEYWYDKKKCQWKKKCIDDTNSACFVISNKVQLTLILCLRDSTK